MSEQVYAYPRQGVRHACVEFHLCLYLAKHAESGERCQFC